MIKRHTLLLGILISLTLLIISAALYPGGSHNDIHSVGYDWTRNYLSNQFNEKAVNGMYNPGRIWAIVGMLLLCSSFALFFITYSRRIPSRSASNVIKFCGGGAMIFSFLAVTPYHDIMLTIASTLILLSMFYITVFIFRTKLRFFKFFSVFTLLTAYACNLIYSIQSYLHFLPVMQKVLLLTTICWILSLHYFTSAKDFLHVK